MNVYSCVDQNDSLVLGSVTYRPRCPEWGLARARFFVAVVAADASSSGTLLASAANPATSTAVVYIGLGIDTNSTTLGFPGRTNTSGRFARAGLSSRGAIGRSKPSSTLGRRRADLASLDGIPRTTGVGFTTNVVASPLILWTTYGHGRRFSRGEIHLELVDCLGGGIRIMRPGGAMSGWSVLTATVALKI